MEHAIDAQVLAVIAGCIVLWGLVSARLERFDITAPIAFLILGLAVANGPFAIVDWHADSETVRTLAEFTLALVLFSDASRVNSRRLRDDAAVPARLLLIGLPLTIAFGTLAALVIFRDMNVWVAAVIGAAVAPTDAALGASIIADERIPGRVRRALNVESGLNDGIVTPLVIFFVACAASETVADSQLKPGPALRDLATGAVVGIVVGYFGGRLLVAASSHGWADSGFQPITVLGLGVFAYAFALWLNSNGFVAAFVAGLAFGAAELGRLPDSVTLTADAGELGSALIWFLFGTLIVTAFEEADWRMTVYAVVSLTVVRMVPVALALFGAGLDRPTVGIIGWFGPRGLASVVFGIIALDNLNHAEGLVVIATISMVILFSVIAHGVTAVPLARWYERREPTVAGDAATTD